VPALGHSRPEDADAAAARLIARSKLIRRCLMQPVWIIVMPMAGSKSTTCH
jgi:hypothetical protein